MLLLTNVLQNQWLMNAAFYKKKQISKLWYHCLLLELLKSLLFKVVVKSPDDFSNHSQTCDDGSLENSHVCSRKSEIQFRAELVALFSSLVSRPPVQVWMKNGNGPGVDFLSSDKDTNVSFLPPPFLPSLFDFNCFQVHKSLTTAAGTTGM